MIPAPDYYTESEGGKWLPWNAGDITDITLEVNTKLAPLHPVNGLLVHSLCWKLPSDSEDIFLYRARWDCINGWTKPLLTSELIS